jgi:flotillin
MASWRTVSPPLLPRRSTFVIPFFQSYGYLDLTPINIEIELKGALSSQNIRIDAPASFTIGISTDPR